MSVKLPVSFKCPHYVDGTLMWMCGKDKNKKITSIFACTTANGKTERSVEYLPNMQAVENHIVELVKSGWIKIKRPTITVTMDGECMTPSDVKS